MDRETFTDGESALIEKIALAAIDEVGTRICAKVTETIKLHAATCPAPKEVAKWKAKAAGFVAGISLVGFVLGWLVTKVLAHVFGP